MNLGMRLLVGVVVVGISLAGGQFASKLVRQSYEAAKSPSEKLIETDPVEISKILPRDNLEEILRAASQDMNKTLPSQIDSSTRLDSTQVGPGIRLVYLHTLLGEGVQSLTESQFLEVMRPQIKNGVCTLPSARMFVENDVEIVYIYRKESGDVFVEVTVLPSKDCVGAGNENGA